MLVRLDPLHDVLLVLLLQRDRRPAARAAARGLGGGQHGSTCTTTSWKPRSLRSAASTASVTSCAEATVTWPGTAMVSSVKRWCPLVRERIEYARGTSSGERRVGGEGRGGRGTR